MRFTCVRTLAGAAIAFAGAASAEALTVANGIPGVLRAGAVIEVVKEGFDGTEGPLPQSDGSLLFTENRAGRIVRIAPDGSTSVLASSFEGQSFNRPNDLVTGRLGQVYFTDPGANAAAGEPPKPVAVYQLAADGRVQRIAAEVGRPNGLALSPDERTLYLADTLGEWVLAFDVGADGAVSGQRRFARLIGYRQSETGPRSGADGLAVDAEGRVYVASSAGVEVFTPRGEALGVLELPKAPQNLAFAGKNRDTLYVVGRGSVYRVATLTRGPDRPGK